MDTIDKLNTALNINLHESDSQQSPEFIHLLVQLTEYLAPNCVTSQTQKDLQQAEEVLRHDKHHWLIQTPLYTELKEMLRDYDVSSLDTAMSSQDKQFNTILQESLNLAEIAEYLECSPDPGSKTSLLGLSKDELLERNPQKKYLPSVQHKLIPDIEYRLRKKCETVVSYHDIESSTEDEQLLFTQSTQLPAQIETDLHRLQELKQRQKTCRENKDKQFMLYYNTLLDSLGLLEKLISKYRLKDQAEYDSITTECLLAKCDSLCLKIKLLELQVLCETYTKDTVKALQCVKSHLANNTKDSQKEHQHISRALQSYESIGSEFNSLVEEYRKLKDEVENKQWALAELQKGDGQNKV